MAQTQQPAPDPIKVASIHWTENEAVALRDFLRRTPAFLNALRAKRPKVTKTESIEARAMSGSEVKGAEEMLDAIAELAHGQQVIIEASPYIGRGEE